MGVGICALLDDPLALDLPSSTRPIRARGRASGGSTQRSSTPGRDRLPDPAELPERKWRIVGANSTKPFGTRELARRLMPDGGSIVATASLAGLTGMPFARVHRDEARGRGLGAQRRRAR
jgi:hypothetical protein